MTQPPRDLRYEVEDAIATITLSRPEKLNAFTRAMGAELVALIDRAEADDAVRCVILTGEGRAFCAGADLGSTDTSFRKAGGAPAQAEPAAPPPEPEAAFRDFGGVIALRLYDALKPVIVAFNGPAAGMGVTLALAADIRLASTSAKFVLPFVRRGIVPESASSWFLPRIVGISRALEWVLRGGTVSVDEALAAGLVRSVHGPEELIPAARALALEIARNTAPVSVALSRQMLWRLAGMASPHEAHRVESLGIESRGKAADIREGVASFMEKRAPAFPDTLARDMPSWFPWWEDVRFD